MLKLRWAAAALGVAALALSLGLTVTAQAAGISWSTIGGPPLPAKQHPIIWQLAASPTKPDLLVAATSQGVWVSRDSGRSWRATSVHRFSWTVEFSAQGTLYAGTANGGVYRSTNGGESWAQDNDGLGSRDVRAITIGPTAVVLGTAAGVYISGTGVGWQSAGLSSVDVSSVAIVADSPLGVVAGSDGQMSSTNLYRNLDATGSGNGAWQPLPGGDPGGAAVFAVAAGPLARGASAPPLLVGNQKGLFQTDNEGASWVERGLGGGPAWTVDAIAFDPLNPAVAYVGGNNGGSTGGGLQRTVDGGAVWGPWQGGLPDTDVNGLQALPSNPVTVLAALWNGSTREPGLATLSDSSAPGPVPLVTATGPIISVHVRPTAPPAPAHHRHSVLPRVTVPLWLWPLGLLVLILVFMLTSLGLRRRRARLEVEAPPDA